MRLSGNNIVRQLGSEKAVVAVPADLSIGALALGDTGQVAALAIQTKEKKDFDGPASLLLWDGKTLKTVSLGERRMSLAEGKRVWDTSPQTGLSQVWPSPDGQSFVSIRSGSVPEVRRVADGAFLRGLGEAVVAALPVKSGQALVALQAGGGQGRIALSTPAGLKTLTNLKVSSLALNHDATRFLSSSGRTIRLHDMSGKVLRTIAAGGEVLALAFTADQRSFSAAIARGAPDYGEPLTAAWTLQGQPRKLPKDTVFPPTSPVITLSQDQNGPQQTHRERLSAWQGNKNLVAICVASHLPPDPFCGWTLAGRVKSVTQCQARPCEC